MLLSIDGTFVVQLINFVIFFALVNAIFMKPVRERIAERRRYIDSVYHDYEQYHTQAQQLRSQADAALAAARRDADTTIAQARAQAQRDAAEVLSRYGEQASSEVERAQAQVRGEVEAARANEDRLVRGLAEELTSRALAGVPL